MESDLVHFVTTRSGPFAMCVLDHYPLPIAGDFHDIPVSELANIHPLYLKIFHCSYFSKTHNANVPIDENAAHTCIFGTCFVVGADIFFVGFCPHP